MGISIQLENSDFLHGTLINWIIYFLLTWGYQKSYGVWSNTIQSSIIITVYYATGSRQAARNQKNTKKGRQSSCLLNVNSDSIPIIASEF